MNFSILVSRPVFNHAAPSAQVKDARTHDPVSESFLFRKFFFFFVSQLSIVCAYVPALMFTVGAEPTSLTP